MGVRVLWYLGAAEGDGLSPLILRYAPVFLDWYLRGHIPYPEELDADVVAAACRVVIHGAAALQPTTAVEAEAVDILAVAMCFEFECIHGMLIDAGPSMLKVGDYADGQPWLRTNGSPLVQTLWHYVLVGRGMGRDPALLPYFPVSHAPDAIVSYWTVAECHAVLPELQALWTRPPEPLRSCLLWAKEAVEQAVFRGRAVVITTT